MFHLDLSVVSFLLHGLPLCISLFLSQSWMFNQRHFSLRLNLSRIFWSFFVLERTITALWFDSPVLHTVCSPLRSLGWIDTSCLVLFVASTFPPSSLSCNTSCCCLFSSYLLFSWVSWWTCSCKTFKVSAGSTTSARVSSNIRSSHSGSRFLFFAGFSPQIMLGLSPDSVTVAKYGIFDQQLLLQRIWRHHSIK